MDFKNNTPASINIGGSVYSTIAIVSIFDFALSTSDRRWGYQRYHISHTPLTVTLCHLLHEIAPICRSRLIVYRLHRIIAPTLTADYPILRSSISSKPSILIRDLTVHDPSHIAHRHSITPSASLLLLRLAITSWPSIRLVIRWLGLNHAIAISMIQWQVLISLKGLLLMRYSLLSSSIPRSPIISGLSILIHDPMVQYHSRSPLSRPFHSDMLIWPIIGTQ